jgi:uncharacterized protein YlxP (DUF503 family)
VHLAVVRFELHLPQSRSLKEKRAVVKPIVEGLRNRFSLSVAEVGYQDKWQRCLVGLAVVSETPRHLTEVVDTVERWVWSRPQVEVTAFERQTAAWDDGAWDDGELDDGDLGHA